MQNKEKCLHATPLSETVLIPTIQIRKGRKSKEEKEGMKQGRKQRGERAGWVNFFFFLVILMHFFSCAQEK